MKLPGGRGQTHRIMEPMEFMARLAALVPPPRHPLVRYHGVFAPNSPWRAVVVPGVTSVARVCEGRSARSAAIATLKRGALADVALAEPYEGAVRARMKLIAVIKDREVIVRILTHVGLPAAQVSTAPARCWDDTS